MFEMVRDDKSEYGWIFSPDRVEYRAFAKYDHNDQGYAAGVHDNLGDAIAAVYYMSILLRAPMQGNA
jgi:hypothetical protein